MFSLGVTGAVASGLGQLDGELPDPASERAPSRSVRRLFSSLVCPMYHWRTVTSESLVTAELPRGLVNWQEASLSWRMGPLGNCAFFGFNLRCINRISISHWHARSQALSRPPLTAA